MSTVRSLSFAAFLVLGIQTSTSWAQGVQGNVALVFDQFVPLTNDTHFDTHNLVVGKPIKTLNLVMTSSGIPELGDMHLPGSEILLDLSNATILDSTNTASELLVSVEFNDPLPIGTYPATKVVFGFIEGYTHATVGMASGEYFDGERFQVFVDAGFVPEPASFLLLAAGIAVLPLRLRRSVDHSAQNL